MCFVVKMLENIEILKMSEDVGRCSKMLHVVS